ncbi:MAG: hypothetical protein KAR06_12135 [Deltaproteobacteria bacterium]|nr:hypothetical protein [Deltaproteobacteria bacterium]
MSADEVTAYRFKEDISTYVVTDITQIMANALVSMSSHILGCHISFVKISIHKRWRFIIIDYPNKMGIVLVPEPKNNIALPHDVKELTSIEMLKALMWEVSNYRLMLKEDNNV